MNGYISRNVYGYADVFLEWFLFLLLLCKGEGTILGICQCTITGPVLNGTFFLTSVYPALNAAITITYETIKNCHTGN